MKKKALSSLPFAIYSILSLLFLASILMVPPIHAASYVGSETCLACHELSESYARTSHYAISNNPSTDAQQLGCEACHGPGSAHAEEGGGIGVGGMISFREDSAETAVQKNAVCLQCHEKGDRLYWRGSSHQGREVTCVECHKIMEKVSSRNLLKARDTKGICTKCHPTLKGKMYRSSHMPLREGKMDCGDCHNPHGTATQAQLRANSVNELCYQCHAERRGPFLWEHAPVRESCLNCHDAHGSVNKGMLKVKMPRLCNECHLAQRHPVTPQLATNRYVVNRGCLNCHGRIHGSNHPSGVRFER